MPTGTIYGEKTFVVQTNGALMRAAQYGPTIVAYRNGNPVRLDEVAHVFDGVENDKSAAWQDGERCVMISIRKQPGTNVVEVVDRIKALLPAMREQLPAAMALDTRNDRSATIRESVRDVKMTLLATIGLVVLVIFLFLRNVSATVIPSLALPASLVGTFTVMYMLNYSLDNLSLMALTLSVGFVVDDAIVMLENIVRHMEMGKDAMHGGVRRVEGNRVHDSVDDDLAGRGLHPGALHGRHRRTAAPRVLGDDRRRDSGVGLRLDQPHADAVQPLPAPAARAEARLVLQRVRADVRRVAAALRRTLRLTLRHRAVTMVVSMLLLVGTVYLFTIVPKGFLPSEDQGRFMVNTEAVQGISYDDMSRHQMQVASLLRERSERVHGERHGRRHRQQRRRAQHRPHLGRAEAARRAQRVGRSAHRAACVRRSSQIPGIRAFMTNQPPINLGSGQGGQRGLYQFTLQDTDTAELYKYAPVMEEKIRGIAGLEDVSSDLLLKNPQVTVDMDRDKVSALGLTANQVENALYNAYGTRQVSQIYAPNNQYQVILQVAPEFQKDPAAMSLLYVRSNTGTADPARIGGASFGPTSARCPSATTGSCRPSRSRST